jgi:hypothetical protein
MVKLTVPGVEILCSRCQQEFRLLCFNEGFPSPEVLDGCSTAVWASSRGFIIRFGAKYRIAQA